jgi:hypothetical protein
VLERLSLRLDEADTLPLLVAVMDWELEALPVCRSRKQGIRPR